MKISFWGSSSFSLEILKALHQKHIDGLLELSYVVSQPAKPVGRKKVLTHNLVAQYALDNNIVLFTPDKIKFLFGDFKDVRDTTTFTDFAVDISLVAAYGKIISRKALDTAKHGFLNFHGSILPKYRGAIPVQLAIWNGDTSSGVTIIKMDEGMDTGDVINEYLYDIAPNTTSGELMAALAALCSTAIDKDFDYLFNPDKWQLTPQDHEHATYCYVSDFSKDKLQVLYSDTIHQAHGKIMAANPEPKAWAEISQNGITTKYNLIRSSYIPGSPVESQTTSLHNAVMSLTKNNILSFHTDSTKKKLYLELHDSFLEIQQIQPEGKNIMDAKSFINGNHKLFKNI